MVAFNRLYGNGEKERRNLSYLVFLQAVLKMTIVVAIKDIVGLRHMSLVMYNTTITVLV
jgi:hypothetical protein